MVNKPLGNGIDILRMQLSSSKYHIYNLPQNPKEMIPGHSELTKPPRSILNRVFAFPPNRNTLGASAYFIVDKSGNFLVDCPLWNDNNLQFLQTKGGVRWLIITHRGGIDKQIKQLQLDLDCEVIIQEQESYLLPEIKKTTFGKELILCPEIELIWTPGYSPGSSCIYWREEGGVLFSGRHLLPKSPEEIVPLRTEKTFHWFRQLQSVQKLRDRLKSEHLNYICPGANTGFLRGKGFIDNAYQKLTQLDLEALRKLAIWS
jgi:glyoxylase-like metal-dependent hydrolase (beta-lactamase superfamily II)